MNAELMKKLRPVLIAGMLLALLAVVYLLNTQPPWTTGAEAKAAEKAKVCGELVAPMGLAQSGEGSFPRNVALFLLRDENGKLFLEEVKVSPVPLHDMYEVSMTETPKVGDKVCISRETGGFFSEGSYVEISVK